MGTFDQSAAAGTGPAVIRTLPVGRAYFADDQGTYLRTTWHLDRGFVNFSVWRGDVCVVTFHLAVQDAARLIAFLSGGLAEAAIAAVPPSPVAAVPPAPATPPPPAYAPPPTVAARCEQATVALRTVRRRLSRWLAPPDDGPPPGA